MNPKIISVRGGIAWAILVLAALVAAPASACLRTQRISFEPAGTAITDQAKVADFLQVPVYGGRQKIVARVSGPDGELARRRVRALNDLLVSLGAAPSGILLETDRSEQERAVLIVYPQPRSVSGQIASAVGSPATPATRRCSG